MAGGSPDPADTSHCLTPCLWVILLVQWHGLSRGGPEAQILNHADLQVSGPEEPVRISSAGLGIFLRSPYWEPVRGERGGGVAVSEAALSKLHTYQVRFRTTN